MMKKNITDLVKEAYDNAVSKGWYDKPRSFGEVIALIHSEASEALEDSRNGHEPDKVWYEYVIGDELVRDFRKERLLGDGVLVVGKPCGIPSELADIVIRVFDACGHYGVDLETAITEKMMYNATRPNRHGGKNL